MANPKKRRTVSFHPLVHQRMRKFADARDVPLARWLSDLATAELDKLGTPTETDLEPRRRTVVRSDPSFRMF